MFYITLARSIDYKKLLSARMSSQLPSSRLPIVAAFEMLRRDESNEHSDCESDAYCNLSAPLKDQTT